MVLPLQATWMTRMRQELPNIRAALDHAFTTPAAARAGLDIAAGLFMYWVNIGSVREGSLWLQRTLTLNPEPTTSRTKALYGCSYLLTMLGDTSGAIAMINECRALAEKLGDQQALGYVAMRLGSIKMYLGDLPGAVTTLEDAVARLRRLGDTFGVIFGLRHLTMAASIAEDPRAADFGAECLEMAIENGAELSKSWALWVVGLDEWRHGDLSQAIAHIREALRLKTVVHDRAGAAHCLEVLAWAAADTSDMTRAARLFGAAHACWQTVGSSLVHHEFFQMLRTPSERKVRDALGEDAYAQLFREGEQLEDDTVTYALGEQAPDTAAGSPSPQTRVYQSLLTRREREVAELVSQGLTNRQIADQLVISPRTAENHVQRILSKLGFTSRAQIAAWAETNRHAS